MTDRVYILRHARNNELHGKFYTSPYTAVLAGERLRRSLPHPDHQLFVPEMFVLDIEEVPCDHTAIKAFVKGFVNFVHSQTHDHGFVMIEKGPCLYDIIFNGVWIAEVLVLFIPPSLDPGSQELGEPILRILKHPKPDHGDVLGDFKLLFSVYSDSDW